MTIEYLLRRMAGGDARPGAIARFTLEKMADGGIHDQLGGGFHRYATDAIWLVPHFEQMLYDNAQLARAYLHAWAETGDARFRAVALEVLDYMLRELALPDGAFAASQDADTDGVEGLTFIWTAAEIRDVLGADADPFLAAYGVTDEGNWEGRTILSRVWPDLHTPPDRSDPALEDALARSRATLLERRATRPQPKRDDKALAAWNGLAIGAFADAGRLLGESRFTDAAVRAAEAILGGLLAPEGALGRSWKDGRASGQGVLEDYTHLAEGLLALYEATFDERWFATARSLMDHVLDHFADPAGGFFDTGDDHERLVARPKDPQDNAVPSGNAMATLVLLRLAAWTGEGRYRDAAERALRTVAPYLERYPTGFAQWLVALDLALAPAVEVAIVGDPADPATQALLAETTRGFRPHQVVAVSASPETLGHPAARRPHRDRRQAHGLRLPRVRLPAAGDDAGGAPRGARGAPRGLGWPRCHRPDAVPVEPRPAATVVLMRSGSRGTRGPPGAPTAHDGLRPGRPRLPRWSRRLGRCAPEPHRAVGPLGGGGGGGPGRRPRPDRGDRGVRGRDPRGLRGGRGPAGRRPAAVARGAGCRARGPGRRGDRVPGPRRPARPDAPDGLARADLALGDAADAAPPVRRPVLRRRAAPRAPWPPSRARRSSTSAGSVRRTRSRRWPRATWRCGSRRARRSSSSST